MNLRPVLSQLYPEGSYQGQCGVFAHKLVNFPLLGDTLKSKIAGVAKYGTLATAPGFSIQTGDILITSESWVFGHVALVNCIINGKLQLTESNYHLDLRVHHTRL